MSEEPMQEIKKRHRPESPEEKLAIYAQLNKIPVQPPCDACPWRKYTDRVQGCDNAGCGWMYLYRAVKEYQIRHGHGVHKANEEKDIE